MPTPIVVVGGSLAGMAAAARLAKVGHEVVLLEQGGHLGGRWARHDAEGGPVDPMPASFTFPAPWRDLFRKSGRILDAELARRGLELTPAPPSLHRFSDGTELILPAERGAQWAAIESAYGGAAAASWRDLLDGLDDPWQALRALGVESETSQRTLRAADRNRLRARASIAALATEVAEPHLAAIITSVARRLGSDPRRTPGWVAVRLALERTFGRWQLTRNGEPVSASVLIDLLTQRLAARGVDVRLHTPASTVAPRLVHTAGPTRPLLTAIPARAVVCATDSWTATLLTRDPRLRRRLRWARPALAPTLTRVTPAGIDEVIEHTDEGPVVTSGTTRHDHREGVPDPSLGPQWRSWRTWAGLTAIRLEPQGVVFASGGSRGGPDPWACLLTGAQAAYAVHAELTGQDIRPTNKALTQHR